MHPSEIKIGQSEYRAYQLIEFIDTGKLKLEKKRKWNSHDMSMSIESILLGLTMTPIYIDASNTESWFVLDGRKRLQSLYAFFKGDFALTELDFFPDYNGHKFDLLPFSIKSKLEEAIFTVYSINQGVSERVRLNLVLRIVPDLRSALSWEFKESLIDSSVKESINSWLILPDYDFARSHFKPHSPYQLVLEYLKLKFVEHEYLNFNLNTNIEYIILELNENPILNIVEWELGLNRLSMIFRRNGLIFRNLYLNKRTIPILIYYFGTRMDDSTYSKLENNAMLFCEKWISFNLKSGKRLLAKSDANTIFKRIDKLI